MIFARTRKSLGNSLVAAVAGMALFASVAATTYNIASRNSAAQTIESTAQIIGRTISVLAAETASAADGYPLPPAGGASLSDGYAIPTTSAAPGVDAYGGSILYCPWDNGATNNSVGRLTGDAPGSDDSKTIAVISGGMNKRLETSCANVKGGISSGDDVVRDLTVSQLRSFGGAKYYLAPVDCENAATPATDLAGNSANCSQSRSRLDLLPTAGIADGALVTIRKSGKVFQWISSVSQWRQASGSGGGYAMPDDFNFTPVTGADTNSLVVSNSVTLSNVSDAAPISIDSNGQYQINGGAWTNTLGTVRPGDTLAVRLTSSTNFETTVSTIVNVAGKTKSFSVTTGSLVIEDVFAVNGYSGNGSTQTITNGIDLAGKGGLVWIKNRTSGLPSYLVSSHNTTKHLVTSSTGTEGNSGMTFGSAGFNFTDNNTAINGAGSNYVSWTFRKAAKFVDVVAFSGNSASGRQISHSLGTAPGMIIIKNLTNADEWLVWHRSLADFGGAGKNLVLNTTSEQDTGGYFGTAAEQTATYFTVKSNVTKINYTGNNYVAYLFAHDTSADGLIQCGTFATDVNGSATVPLGWEPQWLLVKPVAYETGPWLVVDSMRGFVNGQLPGTSDDKIILANDYAAETTSPLGRPLATGFDFKRGGGGTAYIYVAVRRGPMKRPTSGTQLYNAIARTGTGSATSIAGVGFPPDVVLPTDRSATVTQGTKFYDRLRGPNALLYANNSNAEGVFSNRVEAFNQDGISIGSDQDVNYNGISYVNHFFRRYPGVFEHISYTGTRTGGAAWDNIPHGLKVKPELAILKSRSSSQDANYVNWYVNVHSSVLNNVWRTLKLNETSGVSANSFVDVDSSNASTLFVSPKMNWSGVSYSGYLFSSLPGVSKIGVYSGSTSDVVVDSGFSGSPRFLLIKRTDAAGNWVLFDAARGISNGGADPKLDLNTTSPEVNGVNYVEPTGSGFIAKAGNADVNTSGANYLFMAIR